VKYILEVMLVMVGVIKGLPLLHLIGCVAAIFFLGRWALYKFHSNRLSYSSIKSLLTPAELSFYKVLLEVVPSSYSVMMKVRVGDVLRVSKGVTSKRGFTLRAKINQKHFDYVLIKKSSSDIALCVELNDSSHNKRSRRKRDEFLRAACKAGGVKLLEITAKRNYSKSDVKNALVSAL
jgi:hypothetical protein